MKTLAQMTAKYLKNTQGAGEAWKDGVNGVTVNPADSAIAQESLWEMKMQEAIANKTWRKGLQSVTLPGWKAKTTGAQSKYTGAAPQAAQTWNAFAQKAIPVWQQMRETVKAMPKGSREDAMNRIRATLALADTLKGVKG